MAVALAAGALVCAWAPPASGRSVTVVVLPQDTTVRELASAGLSPAVMSAGIGQVPAEQTYLDISQGNRIDDALYARSLPPLPSFWLRVPHWEQIAERADGAPADIAPGLLASSLLERGIRSDAVPAAGSAALLAAERDGAVGRENGGTMTVISAGVGVARKLMTGLGAEGLLIAFAAPSSRDDETLPIGIAGRGFDGDLTSDSTRTDGYVLSTDIAPTILRHFGAAIPDQMDGEPIRSERGVDPGEIEDRADRMTVIPDRRGPVVILCLVAWIAAAGAVCLFAPRARRGALSWLALAFAYMPLMLLAGAALEPSGVAEGLVIGIGAAVLAALTVALVRGWWALAVACAITVVAYAVDMLGGSDLTRLSLLGPNPIYGVRFYGIGNELEALTAVMVPAAVGAALSARALAGKPVSEGGGVAAFLGAGVLAAVVFAAGRFGADVGAAIVLPVGGAVAAACLPRRARLIVALAATPIVALAALALIDLVSGGNAHLTRSVLDTGGAGDLADVAERRLRLSAHDFAQAAGNPLFWLLIAGVALAISQHRRIDAWFVLAPPARAGLLGACAAVAVGVLVNDSGAALLALGSLALGAFLAFAWAQAPGTEGPVRVMRNPQAGR